MNRDCRNKRFSRNEDILLRYPTGSDGKSVHLRQRIQRVSSLNSICYRIGKNEGIFIHVQHPVRVIWYIVSYGSWSQMTKMGINRMVWEKASVPLQERLCSKEIWWKSPLYWERISRTLPSVIDIWLQLGPWTNQTKRWEVFYNSINGFIISTTILPCGLETFQNHA